MRGSGRRTVRGGALALAGALALGGCAAAAPERGELTVYAAASLKPAFDEIAAAFEEEHPDVDVAPVVYDGSSVLATQITQGAGADVFASANRENMSRVSELVADPVVFATNTLVVVSPAGNPAGIESLADLADPSHTVVLCAPEVPCGNAAHELLDRAGVEVTAASEEQNVTAVLTKVAAGEADAGLVYGTDVVGRDEVTSFVPDGAADVVNDYPIASLSESDHPDEAAAFVETVLGETGQRILAEHGFGPGGAG